MAEHGIPKVYIKISVFPVLRHALENVFIHGFSKITQLFCLLTVRAQEYLLFWRVSIVTS